MDSGMALDDATIMATALESILYGVYLTRLWQPFIAEQASCRVFATYVRRYHMGFDA